MYKSIVFISIELYHLLVHKNIIFIKTYKLLSFKYDFLLERCGIYYNTKAKIYFLSIKYTISNYN